MKLFFTMNNQYLGEKEEFSFSFYKIRSALKYIPFKLEIV